MTDTTALKNRIRAAIKANDNQEITGPVLQQALLDIIDELDLNPELENEAQQRREEDTRLSNLITGIKNNVDNGYVYAGIATPSTSPVSGKVFYLAKEAGTYTNFNNTAVTQGINILKYNGSTWLKDIIIGIDDKPTAGSNNLVKSGGVQNNLALLETFNIVYSQHINFYAGSDGLFKFCADDNYDGGWLNINKIDGTHVMYRINSSNNEWNVPFENRLVLDLSAPFGTAASLRVIDHTQPLGDNEITLLERCYYTGAYKELYGCAGWTGGLLLPYIFNTHTVKAPAYDVIYKGNIDFIDNVVIIYSSTGEFLVYSRNGNLVHYQFINEDLTFNLSVYSKLVFDLADKTFKILGENDAIENTQLLLLKRGVDKYNSSFFGFTQGLWLPLLIKKKLQETNDKIQKTFKDSIEAYVVNGQYYVRRDSGTSYTGEIVPCSPGDTIRIYSLLANNGYNFAISFWSKKPIPTSTSTPQQEPSGFISGVKANSSTANKLSLYEAVAPAGTTYVIVSSAVDESAGYAGGIISEIAGINQELEEITENISMEAIYEEREDTIKDCQDINISLADLPVSEDGTDVDEGFAYIDTNNNIKIS